MRKWIFSRSVLLLLIAVAFLAHADDRSQGCIGFAPPNDLYIPDDASLASGPRRGISKAQFNEILDRINAEYSKVWPNITVKGEPPADKEQYERETGKFEKYFSEKPGRGS